MSIGSREGPRKVTLSPAAVRALREIPRLVDSPWVVPGQVEGRPMRNIDVAWWAVCLSLPFIPSCLPTMARLSGTDIILSQWIL